MIFQREGKHGCLHVLVKPAEWEYSDQDAIYIRDISRFRD